MNDDRFSRLEDKMDEMLKLANARDISISDFNHEMKADISEVKRNVAFVQSTVSAMRPQIEWLTNAKLGMGFLAKISAYAGGLVASAFAGWQMWGEYILKMLK